MFERLKRAVLQILFVVFLLSSQNIYSQKFRFSHLGNEEGLSNDGVSCITQDSTGFIWIGTNDGLNRYDGQKFKIYSHKPSDTTTVITNTINEIYPDGDNLWICTNKGIDFFDATRDIFLHMAIINHKGKYVNTSIIKAYKDFTHQLFIATHIGLFKFDGVRKIFVPYYFNDSLIATTNNYEITWISQDRDGVYWIGTLDLGVFVYDASHKTSKKISYFVDGRDVLLNNKVFCIYEDNQGTIWIGTNEGLFAYNRTGKKMTRYMPISGCNTCLPHISVNRIMEDTRNNLWIATNGGLSKFDRRTMSFINYLHNDLDETTISDNSIHAIFEDNQKNLWIGSGENGLSIYKYQSIDFETFKKRINNPVSLNYSYILSVMEDREGNVWIGTNGSGINKYDKKSGKISYFTPPFAASGKQTGAIQAIFEDKDGNIWIGSYLGGLAVYNPKIGKYKTYVYNPSQPNSLSNNIVTDIFQDSKEKIWISTNGGGINLYNPTSDNFEHFRETNANLSSDYCLFVREDHHGYLWIGTFFGLNRFDPNSKKNFVYTNSSKPGSISSDVIYSFCEDSKNQLWFGTQFGLNLFDSSNNSFINYTTENGLPNNVINGILEDNRGYLWLSTNKGICRFDSEDKITISYDVSDGIASSSFFHGAYFKGKSGMFYFGGSQGVTFFNPDKLRNINNNARLAFTELYVLNQPVKPGKNSPLAKSIRKTDRIELKYNEAFITIEYALLNYVSSNKVNYSYYLEGIDKQWNNVGNQRFASYTNLPSGQYTFHLKAIDENGKENRSSIKVIVHPPFYLTGWAYFLYFIIVLSLAYFIYSYIHSRTIYRHNLEIERIEKEKAIELNQAKLKFFINVSHEFKTPLTLIISPIERLITEGESLAREELNYLYHLIYRNALRLYRLINQIIDIRKLDMGQIRLSVSKNDLVDFIKEICLNFEEYARDQDINFMLNCPYTHIPVWFDVDKMEKVVFNILSNSFKYTPKGKNITVTIEKHDDDNFDKAKYPEGYVIISVSDEGKGIPVEYRDKIFTQFFQADSEEAKATSSGIGLSMTKEFVEMHNGIITVESELGKGSTFSVYLPLGNQHFSPDDFVRNIDFSMVEVKEIVLDSGGESIEESENTTNENQKETKKPKILIAEDNYELRKFIVSSLSEEYNVMEADNGKDALKIARESFPDIIISDVMMPQMTGIELCREIKKDIRTSHIPVILLTVLNTINQQVEGLSIGADDYITKPFNMTILKARIFNLIENRKKLIRRFLDDNFNIQDIAHNNKNDEKFLNKVFEILEKNLSNYEFSAEDFAEQVGMSRSNLHIKLKALTNQSATEFIRLYRIKKAAELLVSDSYNISEVAFMVGFNSISYFNRCFKQFYGVTPTEYIEIGKSKKETTH
jgi:ligand-binding sensor domain-containing protein/signal transduction histidine kinase/DNA-binding response OmpR family regulator